MSAAADELAFHKLPNHGNLAGMKTFADFVDAVSGEGDIGAREQCAFCLSRTVHLSVFNLAKDLRELDVSSRGRPWAIHLCSTCAEQYLRLLNAAIAQHAKKDRPRKPKAKAL